MSSLSHMTRSDLEREVGNLREQLEQSQDIKMERKVSVIQLPEHMSYDEGIVWLQRMKKEEETIVDVQHQIACHPLDGALALMKAIQHKYGWSDLRPTPGFFGPKPPAMISMATGPGENDVVQVPWGRMGVPGIDGNLNVGFDVADGAPCFLINGQIKKGHKGQFLELAKAAEHIVNTESVYHHKAVSIKLSWKRENRDFDPRVDGFKFMDVSNVDPNQLIFDKVTHQLLDVTLFSFLDHAENFRKNKIPLKRGVLLEGQYGVGKTLTAFVTAYKALKNKFTFILVEDARDLDQVIKMARRYQPAVIFVEDIDRVVTLNRDIDVDKFLNTIDGIQSKNSEVMLVMTTNHVENIHKAMLRPGRLDAVITLKAPDATAVSRLIKWYSQDMLSADVDLTATSSLLAGNIPATIREVVERAKGIALVRQAVASNGNSGLSTIGIISTEDIELSATGMQRHLELMKEKPVIMTPMELFAKGLGQQLGPALVQATREVADTAAEAVAEKYN